jgi:hypothetical protein
VTIIMPDGHQLVVKRRISRAAKGVVKYDGVLVAPDGRVSTHVDGSEDSATAFAVLFAVIGG